MPDKCIIDPEKDCIGSAKAALLEKRIEILENWQAESKKFHNAFYDWQRDQIARDAKMDVQLDGIQSSLGKLVNWQEAQQLKPAKRWEGIVDKIILTVAGAFVMYVLIKLGIAI